MNKSGLVEAIANATKKPKAEINRILDLLIDTIATELKQGGEVVFPGAFSFRVTERSERNGRNPQTGEKIKIAKRKAIKFKAGSKLTAAVREDAVIA